MADDHRHENYEVYNSASTADMQELRRHIDGLREDLNRAEARIYDLEQQAGGQR